jgi:antirestriction protein ArdC
MTEHTEIKDIYQRITDRIIAELEEGTRPWFKPWNAAHLEGKVTLPLRSTGQPYRGINTVSLWITAAAFGYQCPYWFTFRQAKELGGTVRKGEKGSPVAFYSTTTKKEADEEGEDTGKEYGFWKGYTVFNGDQCDGLPARFFEKPEPITTTTAERIESAERFFSATGGRVKHGGNRAYYSPLTDHIQLPPFETFRDPESYAATKAHEFVHWTGHADRLARLAPAKFGSEDYAKEELVAELGAAFLCADLGVTPEPREDHAAYLATWLKRLKDDKRLIFRAASAAQRAADHLHSYQPKPVLEAAPEPVAQAATAPQTPAEKQAAYAANRAAHSAAWLSARGGQGASPGPG